MTPRRIGAVLAALALTLVHPAFAAEREGPVRVAASIFPLFDFARSVAGDRAEVILLMPPGVDVHTWQPRPRDIIRFSEADLLVYIGSGLEPWVEKLLINIKSRPGRVLEAGTGLAIRKHHVHGREGRGEEESETGAADPHVWLNFAAAETMIRRIRDALAALDPSGADVYRRNASSAVEALRGLDQEFRDGLSRCRTRTFIVGGHAAFGYLAARYGLNQVSLYGLSPDAEPSARHMARVAALMKKEGLSTVFYEVNSSRKLAEVLARETGAALVGLDPAANPTRDQLAAGETFLDIMRRNLDGLRRGLGCE